VMLLCVLQYGRTVSALMLPMEEVSSSSVV
jgi:hypothetical protein